MTAVPAPPLEVNRFTIPSFPMHTESNARDPSYRSSLPARAAASPVDGGMPTLPHSAPAHTLTFPHLTAASGEPPFTAAESYTRMGNSRNSPSAWSDPIYPPPLRDIRDATLGAQYATQPPLRAEIRDDQPQRPHYQYYQPYQHTSPPPSTPIEAIVDETRKSRELTKARRHVCPVCDKRFNRPSSLNTHMSVHTGAKPYQCNREGCGRRFSVSSNLRRHERTHDQVRRAIRSAPTRVSAPGRYTSTPTTVRTPTTPFAIPTPGYPYGGYQPGTQQHHGFDYMSSSLPSSGLREYAIIGRRDSVIAAANNQSNMLSHQLPGTQVAQPNLPGTSSPTAEPLLMPQPTKPNGLTLS